MASTQAKLDARKIFELYEPLILDVLTPEENTVDSDCAAFERTYSSSKLADIIELRDRVQKVRDRTAEMSQVRQWIKQCPSPSKSQVPLSNPEQSSEQLLLAQDPLTAPLDSQTTSLDKSQFSSTFAAGLFEDDA
ncbi:hypothetical protein B0H14DRAFT_3155386 [Mycena olivaceomarginata]|nr:hypothetical protein B0H14DRAFT_3155386 [Mycena olivaceomarginata]